RMKSGELPMPPMAEVMGMHPDVAEHGRVVFTSTPKAAFLNPMGTIHAGYALTLLDTVLACTVHSTLAAGQTYTTLEVKANFVRAILPDSGLLTIEGKILSAGRRIGTSEAKITDAKGRLLAHATRHALFSRAIRLCGDCESPFAGFTLGMDCLILADAQNAGVGETSLFL
ncbi:PaaI family thioesterase, partial [Elstera litoralis]|uniref:PaaI family thioesterase n=1 Tax=Elstera litoralis TaxID=552518 RepID=UPI0006969958